MASYSSIASSGPAPPTKIRVSSTIIIQTALAPPSNERFIHVATQIRQKYPQCFVGVSSRPPIDNSKLSVDELTKKKFTGILNKMTASNIDKLCSMVEELQIMALGDEVLVDIVWKAVGNHGKSYADQLCQVARIIDPDLSSHLWTHKRDYCLAGYLDVLSEGNYDDFCDYSIMTKRYVNQVNFLTKLGILEGGEVVRMCGTHLADASEHQDALLVYVRILEVIDVEASEKKRVCEDVLKSRVGVIPNKIKFRMMDIVGI